MLSPGGGGSSDTGTVCTFRPSHCWELLAALFGAGQHPLQSCICRLCQAVLAAGAIGVTDAVRLSPQQMICSRCCCQAGLGAKLENATGGDFRIAHCRQQVEAGSAC